MTGARGGWVANEKKMEHDERSGTRNLRYVLSRKLELEEDGLRRKKIWSVTKRSGTGKLRYFLSIYK